ncbi:MAG: chromate transporter [Bacteroidaceae bacterium]|jgi:chromate transporter|nr:chromate transporter [Bacteroidaceae bacterium]
MNIYWEGFRTFFKIGCFTLGGGYAMIPLIEEEVVNRKKWLTKEDFLDLMAISQTLPGVFAVNFSIYIGYKLRRLRGSLILALGTILPSFLIILTIAMFFATFADNQIIAAIFKGIRPAIVALIAAPCINLARAAHIKLTNVWLPVFTALAIWIFGVSPIYIIILVAVGGFLYGKLVQPDNK